MLYLGFQVRAQHGFCGMAVEGDLRREFSGFVAWIELLFGLGAVVVGMGGEVSIGAALCGEISHVCYYWEHDHVDWVAV